MNKTLPYPGIVERHLNNQLISIQLCVSGQRHQEAIRAINTFRDIIEALLTTEYAPETPQRKAIETLEMQLSSVTTDLQTNQYAQVHQKLTAFQTDFQRVLSQWMEDNQQTPKMSLYEVVSEHLLPDLGEDDPTWENLCGYLGNESAKPDPSPIIYQDLWALIQDPSVPSEIQAYARSILEYIGFLDASDQNPRH